MPKTKTQPKILYSQRLTQQAIDMLAAASKQTGLSASVIIENAIRLYVMTYDIDTKGDHNETAIN